jgi:hypothetical protein
MRIRRGGVEKRLVVEGDRGVSSSIDHALLKAVARAHCWLDDLVAGRGRENSHRPNDQKIRSDPIAC